MQYKPQSEAFKAFADVCGINYENPALKALEGSMSLIQFNETSPELFKACRMVGEGDGPKGFRTAIKHAIHSKTITVEEVAQTWLIAFRRNGSCGLCRGALGGVFLRSRKTGNYSILLICRDCNAKHEIASGNKSLLLGEHLRKKG